MLQPVNAHGQVKSLLATLMSIADSAKLTPRVREQFYDATYSIETITKAWMEPGALADWRRYELTQAERRIAEYLMARLGKTATKAHLHDALYFDAMDAPGIKIVDIFICRIRGRFERFGAPFNIETDWGFGYYMTQRKPGYVLRHVKGKGYRLVPPAT